MTIATAEPTTASAAQQAASRLRSTADDPVFTNRAEDLNGLADAVASEGRDFRGWDRIDLHAAFSPTSTIHVEPEQGRETLFGALAGASVFLPIIWTWWSLRAAADAYNVMLADGGANGESFMQLWVSGFNGELAPIHQLSTVTLVSVLLIVLAIVLFVVHRVLSDRSQHRQDQQWAQAEAELASVLAQSKRAMAESILADGASFESIVQTSLQKLDEAHGQTAAATAELTQAVEHAERVLNETMQRVDVASTGLLATTETLGSAATSVEAAAKTASDGTSASLDRFGHDLARIVDTYQAQNAQDLRDARDAMAGAVDALTRSRSDFERTHLRAVDLVDRLAGRAEALQKAMDADVADNLDGVRHVVQQLTSTTEDLRSTLTRLEPSLAGNQSAIQAQVSELTNTREALQLLSQTQLLGRN